MWQVLAPQWEALKAFVAHPDFMVAITNPVFVIVCVAVLAFSFWRGWNKLFVVIADAILLWGLLHFTIIRGIPAGFAYFLVGTMIVAMLSIVFVVFRR